MSIRPGFEKLVTPNGNVTLGLSETFIEVDFTVAGFHQVVRFDESLSMSSCGEVRRILLIAIVGARRPQLHQRRALPATPLCSTLDKLVHCLSNINFIDNVPGIYCLIY